MIQIGRKFVVRNDPDDTEYTLGAELIDNEERILIEWDKKGYNSSTYFKKDVMYFLRNKTWIYVKNFNDYLKLCK